MRCPSCSFVYKSGPQDVKCPKCGAYEADQPEPVVEPGPPALRVGSPTGPTVAELAEPLVIQCESREAWLTARRSLIQATDIALILGVSKWGSAWKVQQQKLDPEFQQPDPSEAMEMGHELQDVIGRLYSKKTGQSVIAWPEFTIAVHANGWAGCTPDFTYTDGSPIDVDSKNVGAHFAHEFGDEGTDKVPPDMIAQAVWSMYVRDLEEWHVSALIGGGKHRWFRVVRDRDLEAQVVAQVTAWRERHIVQKEPVPVDGSTAAEEWVNRRFRKGQTITMRATDEAERLMAWLEEAKRAEVKAAEAKNRLKEIMGTATRLEGECGHITWSTGNQKKIEKFDDKKFMAMLEEKYPRAVKSAREICTSEITVDVSRRFQFHPKGDEE